MKIFLRPALVLCALLMAVPALAQQTRQVPVDDTFSTYLNRWTGGFAGRMHLVWRPVRLDGQTYVCGAYAITTSQLNSPVNKMLRNGAIASNGQLVARNLRFFNRVSAQSFEDLKGQAANCQAISNSATSNFEISLGNGDFSN
ncbi:MAG: hypothetical protein AAFY65_20045 [Pseudomonadota bacterium]